MNQYELIRTAHRVYGKSIREIAKTYGHSRKTVRKALQSEYVPYQRKQSYEAPVMGPYQDIIDEWLVSDQTAPKKQRHTSRRIYQRLVDEYEFTGAESTVRVYVGHRRRSLDQSRIESMIPRIAPVGQEAEVDWGEAVVKLGGVETKVHLFCLRSRYSGQGFVRAYPNEKQEMFFDGHIQAFTYLGGVFPTLVYDNLTTAVKKILRGHRRLEQDQFRAFRGYYTFESRFCNPAKGHEKGGVEGFIGTIRRNWLVPVPEFADLEALNRWLLEQCEGREQQALDREGQSQPIADLFERERPHLLSLPSTPFTNQKTFSAKVDSYQTVCIGRNHYSVPHSYTGQSVQVLLGCHGVEIFAKRRKIAQHSRLFGRGQWALDPYHYLDTLSRKPGAFDEARPIVDWRKTWPSSYEQLLEALRQRQGQSLGTREFIGILKLQKQYPPSKVEAAVEITVETRSYGLESVKLLLDERWVEQLSFPSLEEDRIPGVTNLTVETTDLSQFNQLMN